FDGPGPGPPARGGRPEAEEAARALAGGEVLHRAVDHAAVDAPLLLRVAEEQTVVAGEVHETRHALRPLPDPLEGALAEDAEVPGAGDPQSGPDELARLLDTEQRDAAAQGDPLAELTQLRQGQLDVQLGLTGQHDLKELAARALEVREQPHLFQG